MNILGYGYMKRYNGIGILLRCFEQEVQKFLRRFEQESEGLLIYFVQERRLFLDNLFIFVRYTWVHYFVAKSKRSDWNEGKNHRLSNVELVFVFSLSAITWPVGSQMIP